MYQLLTIVLAIILSAILITGGVNYINGYTGTRIEIEQKARTGFTSWESLYRSYQMANRFPPSLPVDDDDTTWADELAHYGNLPAAPGDMKWSYHGDGASRWFCLSYASVGPVDWEALRRLPNHFADSRIEVKEACEPPSVGPDPDYDVSGTLAFPAPVAVRYIVDQG